MPLILDTTTRSLEIKLGGAITTSQLHVTSSYGDKVTSGAYTGGTQLAVTNNTTAVTVLSAPGASTQRVCTAISIANRDTVSADVTIQYNDNTTIREIIPSLTLSTGDILQYVNDGWEVTTNTGQKKSIVSAVITSALPAGTNNIGDVDVLTLPAITGTVTANAGTNLNTSALALEATQTTANTLTGIVTETAPASDTASSGLNGRLQRVAQRITSLIALLPTALVSNRLDVNLGAAPATVTVAGNVAHDSADSGNPQKIGMKAVAYGTNPTAVTAADRTDWYANRHGVPFVISGHPNIITLEAAYTAAQTDAAIVTIAGGLKIAVTQIQFVADNANTVDVGFRIGFATATTPTTTGVVLTHPGVPAGSGISRGDGSAVIGIGADGEDLRITSEVPTTGSVRVLVSYFTIES